MRTKYIQPTSITAVADTTYGVRVNNTGYAIDNDSTTYCSVNFESSVYTGGTFTLTIDLGEIYNVNSIIHKYFYYSLKSSLSTYITYSSDGSTWNDLKTITSTTSTDPVTETLTVETNLRYIKYYGRVGTVTSFRIYEVQPYIVVEKENSGIRMSISADRGIVLAAEKILAGPLRFYTGSTVKSLYLISPSDTDATGLRIKCDPLSTFVQSILGSGSDGILAAAIWS